MPPPPAPPKRTNRLGVAALLVAMFVSAVLGVGLAAHLRPGSTASPTVSAPATIPDAGTSAAAGSGTSSQAQAVAAKVNPGIVDINTVLGYQGGSAAGTGMVLTSSGEVLTNNHVVAGATSIKVTSVTTGRTYTAKVVGTDPADDIAVLQLQGASGLKTVSTADSSKLSVGTGIVAIGNAYGAGGSPSVVTGNIIALGQTITAGDASGGAVEQLSGLIETNASLQPGDSGGPLVTSDGKVIGMDTAASASYRFQAASGVSFAIPINTALSVAKQIESGTAPNGGTLGTGAFLGVSVDRTQTGGAVIAAVPSGTPAQAAGLVAGDTVTSVDAKTITSATDLTSALATHKPGDRVAIGWDDATGQHHTAVVPLASAPAN
jgi:S1-C subfamily serine protease